ncbi:MAG: DUF4340 domain-containing protein [Nitrospinaceae bacterium]
MKFRGTALMAAVFLGLVLYYFFVDLPAEQKEKTEQEQAEKLIPLEAEKVVEFSLTGKGEHIALKREALHNWKLTLPFSASGDSTEAEAFISEIASLKKTRTVEEHPKDLSIYGLSSPFLKIHFKFENKKEETLLIGNESPLGGHLYFKRGSQSAVMMAASSQSGFEKSIYSFRDKTLLNFNTSSIQHIQILREKNPLELKKTGEVWRISGDIRAQGDKDAIMNFLQAIQFSQVTEFVDEAPESMEPYGLNPPKLKLVLDFDDGSQTLSLGNLKEGKGYFGRINDSKNIILVGTRIFEVLSQKTVDFLDKTLFEFEEKEILQLSLQSKSETIRVIRDKNDSWNIQSPIKTAADLSTVNSLLFDLKEAQITKYIKISMDTPESFGLDNPQKSFSLKIKNSKNWTLQLGNQSADGQQIFAQWTGQQTVFSISKEVVDKLFRSLHDLRNKKILRFESAEVNKVLIQTPENLFELRKNGPQWSLEKPEKIKTDHIGNDLVWTLKGLEFSSIITPPLPANLSGLDSPSFTLRIFKNNEEEIATLKVGKFFVPEQEYLVETGNLQYRVKSKSLDSIPLSLDKFNLK